VTTDLAGPYLSEKRIGDQLQKPEYIAAPTLNKETAIEGRKVVGMVRPRIRKKRILAGLVLVQQPFGIGGH
jgi:hypothetical protein